MNFIETSLKGAYVVELESFKDGRGYFARTFCQNEFEKIGHHKPFVQINHSFTIQKGTLRGMHFQVPPSAEAKLIRCISGEVYDVIIDIRNGSPTFLQHFAYVISSDNMRMIYVPEGFAHGFLTLKDNTQLIYHHTAFYSPSDERGLNYKDPSVNIQWPSESIVTSDRDLKHPYIDNSFTGIKL